MCASKLHSRFGAALMLAASLLGAAQAADADREQEQLRRLKMQLRQVQQQQEAAVQEANAKADADKASFSKSIQSAQGEAAAQRQAAGAASRRVKALSDELDALKKDKAQLAAELAQVKQQLDEGKTKAADQQAQASQTVATWQARHKQMSDTNEQCRAQNAQLYVLGTELLGKYERKGLGEVLSAKEPFVQTARVKLENTKAEYQDKLDAAKLKPVAAGTDPAAKP
jgi:chromosome segregation ATPase